MTQWMKLLPQSSGIHIKLQKLVDSQEGHFEGLTWIDFFTERSHRSIPGSVNNTLYHWHNETFLLHIYFDIPSPWDVFEMQTQGFRCVSLLLDFNKNSLFNNDRDPLGFLLHDLIHAHQFFSNSEMVIGQTQFLQKLQLNLQKNQFDILLKDHPDFEKDFHYLISDMNSHPAHLALTLIAVLRKRLESREDLLIHHVQNLVKVWNAPLELQEAFVELCKGVSDRSHPLEIITKYFLKGEFFTFSSR